METKMYLGDAVYATFDGNWVKLEANGIGPAATDRIYLEPEVVEALKFWIDKGFTDYNSGRTYKETIEDVQTTKG